MYSFEVKNLSLLLVADAASGETRSSANIGKIISARPVVSGERAFLGSEDGVILGINLEAME